MINSSYHNNMSILSSCLSEGRLKVNMSEIALSDIEKLLKQADPSLSLGGHWKPHDCLPRWKVSQLIPTGVVKLCCLLFSFFRSVVI